MPWICLTGGCAHTIQLRGHQLSAGCLTESLDPLLELEETQTEEDGRGGGAGRGQKTMRRRRMRRRSGRSLFVLRQFGCWLAGLCAVDCFGFWLGRVFKLICFCIDNEDPLAASVSAGLIRSLVAYFWLQARAIYIYIYILYVYIYIYSLSLSLSIVAVLFSGFQC